MAKPQWISASDPYWSQFTQDLVDGGYNPYGSTISGLESLENWSNVARQLGFTGPIMGSDPDGSYGYTTDFYNFVQQKKAEGYDFVVKGDEIDKSTSTFGLRTPSGEVVGQRKATAAGFGEVLKDFVLPAVAAYGAVNFLGPRLEGLTNALSGGGPITAADLSAIPTNAMGQVSQAPALEVMDLAPLESAVTNVTTPAAVASDAAAAMQLRPMTQLQPITFGGEPYLTAGAGGGAGAGAAGLSLEALDAALAGGAPIGATTGAAPLGGVGLPELTTPSTVGGVPNFLSGMSDVAATEGAGVAGTGILTKGTNIPSSVLGGGTILDKTIDLLKTPAGGALLSATGSVVGGITQASAAEKAAEQQAAAAQNALALQREMFEYQKGLLEPYRTAGTAALERLTGAMGLGGPAQQQQMLEMDPGYGFRLGEGMKALERMQAARGNMLSGGALKAGQRYAQDFASGEYGNAYNRLANIAGLGQTAGTQLGGAASQFGQTAGNIMGQEANALAAGRIGRGSAYGGAIQGGLNAYSNYLNQQQQNQLFRDIFGRTVVGG